ncbi:bifunctional DNA primase/polymerase [Terrabacter sp. Soil811]|uniref:bifunctional DNA primase/polymerase n=1 Tax=Terrabacter sp. Soil811 TaxID=1736419 RepID=UPI0009E770A3|nr:bifunctional DNA primase/polymerase [Terrabacter sp. Soil811]
MSTDERRPLRTPSESPAKVTDSKLRASTDGGPYVPDVSFMSALQAAQAYAEAGLYVGPTKKGSKDPGSILGKRWPELTSRHADVIKQWFTGRDRGLFVHCGRSGLVVFDVDHPDRVPPLLAEAIRCQQPAFQETRADRSGRGHYVFLQPPGRMIGNSLGSLERGWGEVRGRNGVIIVQPSVHQKSEEGGSYEWATVGPIPILPPKLAVALTDATESLRAATDAEVRSFLDTHTDAERPELLGVWARLYTNELAAGASRHQAMVSKATGAMEEAAAGLLNAAEAAKTLKRVFFEAVCQPTRGDSQRAARTVDAAEKEWHGIMAWAVAHAKRANPEATRVRAAAMIPPSGEALNSTTAPLKAVPLGAAHAVFRRWLGSDYDLDVLDAVLAVAAVEKLSGDPAWLLVVSGSGAAKTETVAPLAVAGAFVTSTISSEGALLSGTSQKERAKTATGGLLRKIGGSGVLVIKDVTSILSMNRDSRASVLAALREVYDGRWERNLGSDGGQSLAWDGRIVVIGAVTTAWDRAHEVIASMGDRFLLIRLDSTSGRVASGRQAIANTGDEVDMRAELGDAVAGVLAGVDDKAELALTKAETEQILALANVVTLARTGVDHDYRGDVIDAHAPEMPTRFAKQLTQVMRGGLALGMDRQHILRIVTRIARDSIPPLRLAVLLDLMRHDESTTTNVRKRIDKPRATVDRTLQALHMLDLVTVSEEEGNGKQRTVWWYSLAAGVDVRALRWMQECQKCQETDAHAH